MRILSYRSKQSKCCLDQQLKDRLAYLNFDAIFEFLGQFTIRYIYIVFQKDVDNFQVKYKTC